MNKFIPILLFLLAGPWLHGQVTLEREVISSLGQVSTGSSLHLSGTAGEAAITTQSATGLLLTQGFHQAEPEDLTSVHLVPSVISNLSTYPNPASGEFWVQVTTPSTQRLSLAVFDVTGRELANATQTLTAATMTPFRFSCAGWPAGLYLVRIITDQGHLAGSARIMVADK